MQPAARGGMQEPVDYADVRRVLSVTRIRLRAMDFPRGWIDNIERIVVDRDEKFIAAK
jgi:hypothetical protein